MKKFSTQLKKLLNKKVVPHLKEDVSEFKEQIADDKKLRKTIKAGMKKAPAKKAKR